VLPLSAFGRNNARNDGRQSYCKDCRRSGSFYVDGYGFHEGDHDDIREEHDTEYYDDLYSDQRD
jgi:hypothetical protein